MKPRTIEILSALITDFVETATPVASQKLLTTHQFPISSATVRNEFALLEEVGYIASPHVSAGKIPTQKGFRFFVDTIMPEMQAENDMADFFEPYVQKYCNEKSKESVFDMVRLVSQISGNVAFAHFDRDETFYLGLSSVLRSPEFLSNPEKAAQIIEVLEGRHQFQSFLSNIELEDLDVKIYIGDENLIEEISSCAVLVTSFKTAQNSGYIGIVGPMRMQYGFNKALLQNVKKMIL